MVCARLLTGSPCKSLSTSPKRQAFTSVNHFGWYLRGPYSPSLTQDVYTANENHDVFALTSKWKLDDSTVDKLAKLRPYLDPPPDGLTQPQWLELLASVHFLVDRGQVSGEPLADVVRGKLEKFGKDFTPAQIECGLDTLRKLALLPE